MLPDLHIAGRARRVPWPRRVHQSVRGDAEASPARIDSSTWTRRRHSNRFLGLSRPWTPSRRLTDACTGLGQPRCIDTPRRSTVEARSLSAERRRSQRSASLTARSDSPDRPLDRAPTKSVVSTSDSSASSHRRLRTRTLASRRRTPWTSGPALPGRDRTRPLAARRRTPWTRGPAPPGRDRSLAMPKLHAKVRSALVGRG